MAKKAMNTENENVKHEDDFPPVDEGNGEGGFKFDTEFDINEEYKIPPLIPAGKYEAYVTGVRFDAGDCALVWDVALRADDDILMSDNETPVNGNTMTYKNYFPKAGDESVRTKSGKMTKRQAKINMIQDFQKKMKINMGTPQAITEAVQNAEWIGIDVVVAVQVREYEGRMSNQINEMVAA